MKRIFLSAAIIVAALFGTPLTLHAAEFGSANKAAQEHAAAVNDHPLTATVSVVPGRVGVGGTAEFVFSLDLADDYKAYLDRFKVTLDEPEGLILDRPRLSPVIDFLDSVTKKMKQGVHGHSEMRLLFEIPQDFKQGTYTAKINLGYQACTESHCLFPQTLHLEATFDVTSGMEAIGSAPAASGPDKPTLISEKGDFETILKRGILPALVFVFTVGFLTSLTPCIYPMIPITLAILGARSKGHSKLRSLGLSVVYVLGIAITYSALGVLAASTGALFGSALSNIYVVSVLALIFFTMGLSMYGLFEIQAPAFIRKHIGGAKTDAGFSGAFFTGLIAGVVASPCIGPVLVSVLAYIARTQDRMLGFLFLFTFALGMGVLFIILGLSSSLMHRLPKAGPWMEGVKYLFGSAMVIMALYYIAPVYPPWLFRLAMGASMILVASLLGAFEPTQHLKMPGHVRKGIMLAVFFIGVAFAAAGALERAGVPIGITSASGGQILNGATDEGFPKLAWQPYSNKAVQAALQARKPVLIDFYADWCAACKELERETFIDPRIRGLSDQFTLLKIDATNESEALDRLKAQYHVLGLPTLIFYDVKGAIRGDLTVTGFENADAFLVRMKAALGE
jgi:thiol:disulfide interchange protein DsbD